MFISITLQLHCQNINVHDVNTFSQRLIDFSQTGLTLEIVDNKSSNNVTCTSLGGICCKYDTMKTHYYVTSSTHETLNILSPTYRNMRRSRVHKDGP